MKLFDGNESDELIDSTLFNLWFFNQKTWNHSLPFIKRPREKKSWEELVGIPKKFEERERERGEEEEESEQNILTGHVFLWIHQFHSNKSINGDGNKGSRS